MILLSAIISSFLLSLIELLDILTASLSLLVVTTSGIRGSVDVLFDKRELLNISSNKRGSIGISIDIRGSVKDCVELRGLVGISLDKSGFGGISLDRRGLGGISVVGKDSKDSTDGSLVISISVDLSLDIRGSVGVLLLSSLSSFSSFEKSGVVNTSILFSFDTSKLFSFDTSILFSFDSFKHNSLLCFTFSAISITLWSELLLLKDLLS